MNDDSFVDAHSLLDRSEKWARDSLHDYGYSDTFIDEWIQVDDGLDLETALELITTEHEYKLMLIRHIDYLRDQLSNGDQSPIDWICNGYLLAWFLQAGSMNEIEELWFSELQSKNAKKKPRNRASLAKTAIEYVLQNAPAHPGTTPGASPEKQAKLDVARAHMIEDRGRELARFRHCVGEQCRITINGTTIEITSVEDDWGRIIGYVFENLDLPANKSPPMTKMNTIRKIISRLNNKRSNDA